MRLLIVEDDTVVRRALIDVVGEDFGEVVEAEDGVEALESALAAQPDLVLLDISMPRMGGLETCVKMREHASLRDVPIVILTAHSSEAEARAAFAAGATDYIVKPFAVGNLRARLRQHLLGSAATPAAPTA